MELVGRVMELMEEWWSSWEGGGASAEVMELTGRGVMELEKEVIELLERWWSSWGGGGARRGMMELMEE